MFKKLLPRKSARRWLGSQTELELERHFGEHPEYCNARPIQCCRWAAPCFGTHPPHPASCRHPCPLPSADIERKLGKGSYAVVFAARRHDDGQLYALKVRQDDLRACMCGCSCHAMWASCSSLRCCCLPAAACIWTCSMLLHLSASHPCCLPSCPSPTCLQVANIHSLGPLEQADVVNEIRLLASLSHPNLTTFYESFCDHGKLCIVQASLPLLNGHVALLPLLSPLPPLLPLPWAPLPAAGCTNVRGKRLFRLAGC